MKLVSLSISERDLTTIAVRLIEHKQKEVWWASSTTTTILRTSSVVWWLCVGNKASVNGSKRFEFDRPSN